ncbi:MAG: 16S rRNA (guanine(527)-N(7))-methyltransferase RsmG, partial [Pseudomonadota bacterium]
SRETSERLLILAALLQKWNPKINLVAAATIQDLWVRHITDSAQLWSHTPPFKHWADLGAGGGFPGAVIAILAQSERPDAQITLVESDRRKATFLRTVARETGVGFTVSDARIEALDPLDADIVSARALAPLDALLPWIHRHLAPGGTALLPKGRRSDEELEKALETWRFTCQKFASTTSPLGAILKLTEIERA